LVESFDTQSLAPPKKMPNLDEKTGKNRRFGVGRNCGFSTRNACSVTRETPPNAEKNRQKPPNGDLK
jgi:hypothetical protein